MTNISALTNGTEFIWISLDFFYPDLILNFVNCGASKTRLISLYAKPVFLAWLGLNNYLPQKEVNPSFFSVKFLICNNKRLIMVYIYLSRIFFLNNEPYF